MLKSMSVLEMSGIIGAITLTNAVSCLAKNLNASLTPNIAGSVLFASAGIGGLAGDGVGAVTGLQ